MLWVRITLLLSALALTGCPGNPLKRAAENGDSHAQYSFALEIEKSNPIDSRRFLLLAASKGVPEAQLHLGEALLQGAPGQSAQPEKAFYWISKASTLGNSDARDFLTICHLRGIGTTADVRRAVDTLHLPNKRLDGPACLKLAVAILADKNKVADKTVALDLLEQGIQIGDSSCMVALAKYGSTDKMFAKDQPRINSLLEKASLLKNAEATYLLGYRILNGIGTAPRPTKGIELLRQASELGQTDAICDLFWPLSTGRFTKKDPEKAFELLLKAQAAKNPRAFSLLARCYLKGMGTPKDELKVIESLRQGAALDDAECLEWLGAVSLGGLYGQQRSLAEALHFYERAAGKGIIDAHLKLYDIHKEMSDPKAALAALEKGSSLGSNDCSVNLGMAHEFGRLGLEADEQSALRYYLAAARNNDRYGKYFAGATLLYGAKVEKDVPQAVIFIKEASSMGVYGAQYLLASLYADGRGVPQDASLAYFWANISASLNPDDKDYQALRDKTAKALSASDRTKVQGQCRTWLARSSGSDSDRDEESGSQGGSGSGIIFASEGLVLTNHHVVATGSVFTIITSDGNETPASLVAKDAELDVAVLRMGKPFKSTRFTAPPPLASSSRSKSGEKVFTVGHPLAGILSSEAKYNEGTISALSGMQDDQHLMQISVPIQPGNSGGPLANSRGEIVGLIVSTINGSALLRQRDIMAQNINFAIKSDPIIEFLKSHGIAIPSNTAPTDPVEHVKNFAVKVVVTP